MYGLSTADGFLNVKEGVDEMIKHLANEPSVGLYFVQQHAHASMPYLLTLKDEIVEKIHEVTLRTEDIEDSIDAVKSMSVCGLPIMDQMIKDVNNSLVVMSTAIPKRGPISNRSSGGLTRSRSLNPEATFDNTASSSSLPNSGSSRGYLSAVFSSAKQKAAALRWSQLNPPPSPNQHRSAVDTSNISSAVDVVDAETDELPLSSTLADDQSDEADPVSESLYMTSTLESFEKFKSEREAKLEAWLQES